jgi:hypothetical protein
MAAIHPPGAGPVPVSHRSPERPTSRSAREGSAAGLLVGIGAAVAVVGLAMSRWWGAGETIATIGLLLLLPAAVLQAVIGLVDGVRDHDSRGESRSAAYGLIGVVVAVACLVVAVVIGL